MVEKVDYKYKAFVSYCHKDTKFADKIIRTLAGDNGTSEGSQNLIAKTLQPIFKDKSAIPFGQILSPKTIQELKSSAYLIVLCSPNAAENPDVYEEIRVFKLLGRAQEIIPLILYGEAGNPEKECLPPSLRYKVDEKGKVSNEPDVIQTIDIRDHGDKLLESIARIKNKQGPQKSLVVTQSPIKLEAEPIIENKDNLREARVAAFKKKVEAHKKSLAEETEFEEIQEHSNPTAPKDIEQRNLIDRGYNKIRELAIEAKVVGSRPLVEVDEAKEIAVSQPITWIKKYYYIIPACIAIFLVAFGLSYSLFLSKQVSNKVDNAILPLMVRYASTDAQNQNNLPAISKGLKQTFYSIIEFSNLDHRHIEVLQLLNGGRPQEAEILLKNIADNMLGANTSEIAAQAYRNYAVIASLNNVKRAVQPFARAAKLQPSHAPGMFWHGWMQKTYGSRQEARRAFSKAMTSDRTTQNNWFINNARLSLWDLDKLQQDNVIDNVDKRQKLIAVERLRYAEIKSRDDKASELENSADTLVSLGSLSEALKQYNSALFIRLNLVKLQPHDQKRLLDVFELHNKLASIMVDQTDLNGAASRYLAAITVIDRLLVKDPQSNTLRLHQVKTHQKLAAVKMANKENNEALRLITKALIISRPIAETTKDKTWVKVYQGLEKQVKLLNIILARESGRG